MRCPYLYNPFHECASDCVGAHEPTTIERLAEVAKRFDPDMDGYSIGVNESDAVLAIGNEALSNPHTRMSREYFTRIAQHSLFG